MAGDATKPGYDPWDVKQIEAKAPDGKSVEAARKLLKKGAFGAVESRADGQGWWAVCKGLTDTYQVSVRRGPRGGLEASCTCPSYKHPCKHALALLIYLAEHPEARPEVARPKVQASELDALVRAVFAAPDDDLPRLVFADYLEERGEGDRAALIRLQCEAAKTPPKSARGAELAAEEKSLTAKVRRAMGTLPEGFTVSFRRGFIHLRLGDQYVQFNAAAVPARVVDVFRDGWVETVKVVGYYTQLERDLVALCRQAGEVDFTSIHLPADTLGAVAVDLKPGLPDSRIARVKVHKLNEKKFAGLLKTGGAPELLPRPMSTELINGATAGRIEVLTHNGRFKKVSQLTLVTGLGDDGAAALAAADLGGLAHLSLLSLDLGPEGLAALGGSGWLRRVRYLEFRGVAFTDDHVAALEEFPDLPKLEALIIDRADLGDDAAVRVARMPQLRRLSTLWLTDNGVTPAGAARVLAEVSSAKLEMLALNGNPIPPAEFIPIAVAAGRDRLVVSFTEANVTWDAGTLIVGGHGHEMPDLFARPLPKSLRTLAAHSLHLDPAALGGLLDALAGVPLTALRLTGCHLRNDAVVELARWLPAMKLEELDLSNNEVGVAGAKALAASPGLATVRVLNLSDNPLGQGGPPAVLASEHFGALEQLRLGGEVVSAADKKALQKRLGRKVEVTR